MFEKPDVVFIHIPKTAGTAIRAMWDYEIKFRTFGHIPAAWRDKPSFSIVRNPEDRFLSAIRMFKFGNPEFGGFYGQPVWPDLTIDMALNILADDSVAFERSQKYLVGNFRHHIIAQTHPYNCLKYADTILRQETLGDDIEQLRKKLGFSAELQLVRHTGSSKNKLTVSAAHSAQIHAAFAQDYAQLGYATSDAKMQEISLVKNDATTLWESWPAFYCSKRLLPKNYARALPNVDVDLSIFAKETMTGESGKTWPGRFKDINKHFHHLVPEFVGRSRLAHLLACTIVMIRKTNGSGPGLELFYKILDTHLDHICTELNTRWLTSVCDTLVDCGRNNSQKSLGLCGSILANTIKLSETELKVFHIKRPWPPNAKVRREATLFDGLIGFGIHKGDMIANLFERIEKAGQYDKIAGRVVSEIAQRMVQNNTLFRRFLMISGNGQIPTMPRRLRNRLEKIARTYL